MASALKARLRRGWEGGGVLLTCDSERYAGMHIAGKKETICQICANKGFKAWRIRNLLPFFEAGSLRGREREGGLHASGMQACP